MTAVSSQEAYIFDRFDRLAWRFRTTVDTDDFRLRAVVQALPRLDGLRVLDLGCGAGRFGQRLGELGSSVIGIDPSVGMLGRASAGFSRVLGSARRLPFADGSFDAVVAIEVIEHIPREGLGATLAEVLRVLRVGGTLVVIDKNAGSLDPVRPYLPGMAVKWIDEARGRWMYPAGAPVRERWFWPRSLGRLMAACGFAGVQHRHLKSPQEAGHSVFDWLPTSRRFVVWSARRGVLAHE
jgi:2-polyprenyl-6-hydroxyphenyl methylase/3-demethylubiquinone-9 3-methyltransferase